MSVDDDEGATMTAQDAIDGGGPTVWPLYVTSPEDGSLHAWNEQTAETLCGRDCGEWPVIVGGVVTCQPCVTGRQP